MKALSCLFLAVALALPAAAVRPPDVVSTNRLAKAAVFNPDGSPGRFNGNPGLEGLFDGNFDIGVVMNTKDAYVVIDFADLITNANMSIYVSGIDVGHKGNCEYSLYYGNVSNGQTNWTAVVEGAKTTGTASYSLGVYGTLVKYVFYTVAQWSPSLTEIQVLGYVSTKPAIISKSSLAKMYWADGTMTANNGTEGFGGGTGIGHLFNGNFGDSVYIGPNGRLNNGGFCMLDFSSEMPGGYFITEIKTGSLTTHKYSLKYSMDGTTWTDVDGATEVSAAGQKTFNVNDTAVYVKCVFDQIGGWTPAFNELRVWGMDPLDAPCLHPSYTPWTPVAGSATCLANGIDEQFCTECGARVTRESTTLFALGHDYVPTLAVRGRYKGFGRGSVACSRCDWFLDCSEPLDLITNRVNGERIGNILTAGFFHFTEVSVSSTGNTDWGIRPGHIIGDNWTWSWNHYWYSDAGEATPPHADFEFGTDVDLVCIDVSLPNSNHTTCFFSVDDDTGAETRLERFLVTRTDPEKGDKYHIWADPEVDEWENAYVDPDSGYLLEFDELPVVRDGWIPSRKHDAEGNEIQDNPNTDGDDGSNDYNSYQRFTVRFFEQPIRHLRIRQYQTDGSPMKPMYVSELHPWGTVRGAGDMRYRRETIMILR